MAERSAVLLIEDEPNLLKLNMHVLEREGYYVLPARNLREARGLIDGVAFHAAVLDMEPQDGECLDFCRELRKMRGIPVVFLISRDGEECEKTVADDYITKPYRLEQLTGSLGALLARTVSLENTHNYQEGK